MQKQTQKKNNKKRTILLATLIPVGAIAVATAITVPLVLKNNSQKGEEISIDEWLEIYKGYSAAFQAETKEYTDADVSESTGYSIKDGVKTEADPSKTSIDYAPAYGFRACNIYLQTTELGEVCAGVFGGGAVEYSLFKASIDSMKDDCDIKCYKKSSTIISITMVGKDTSSEYKGMTLTRDFNNLGYVTYSYMEDKLKNTLFEANIVYK